MHLSHYQPYYDIVWFFLQRIKGQNKCTELHVKGEIGWNTAYSASVEINVVWKYFLTTWLTYHVLQNSFVQTLIMRRPKSEYSIYKYKIYCLHPIMKWILTKFENNNFFQVSFFGGPGNHNHERGWGRGYGRGEIAVTYVCYEIVVFDMCFIFIKNWIDVFIFVTQYHG